MVGTQTIPAVYDHISPTKSNPTNEQLLSPNSTFTFYVHKAQTSSKEYYALKVANIFHTPKFPLTPPHSAFKSTILSNPNCIDSFSRGSPDTATLPHQPQLLHLPFLPSHGIPMVTPSLLNCTIQLSA